MIFGLEASSAIPENFTPLEAIAVVKCLDEEGGVTLLIRSTQSLNAWEALGMLRAGFRTQDDELAGCFEDEEEGGEE